MANGIKRNACTLKVCTVRVEVEASRSYPNYTRIGKEILHYQSMLDICFL